MNLRVPDVVANAAAACGAGGWLRGLPGLIAELEAEWSVSVGRPFAHARSVGTVVPLAGWS